MLRDIPIKMILIAGLIISGVIPLLSLSLLSYETAKKELKTASFNQLESVRKIKTNQLSTYYRDQLSQLQMLALNPYILEAAEELETNSFSAKTSTHHQYFSKYIDFHRLYDLLLISRDKGLVFYSVKKESDYREKVHSSLEKVWNEILSGKKFAISDTSLYRPSNNTPAQFLATGIYRNHKLVSVLAIQISLQSIDSIMSERSGLGKTGETYLVGKDYRMRSDSYLDPINHSVQSSLKGELKYTGVKTIASQRALSGLEGSDIIKDYNNNFVLSSYGPFDFYGHRWAVIAEIDEAEIDQVISNALNGRVVSIILFSLLLLLLMALLISQLIGQGAKNIILELERLIDRVLLHKQSPGISVQSVPVDLREMARRMNQFIEEFARHLEDKTRLEHSQHFNQRLEAIGALSTGLAHDFNNTLTYMYTYADLVQEKLSHNDPSYAHMEEILKAIDRAKELAGQVTAFARDVKKEKSPILFDLIVKESLKLMQASFPKTITLKKAILSEGMYVLADPTSLHQLVINLCTNAFHALIAKGGELEVTLDRESILIGDSREIPAGEFAHLTVRDNGEGIAPDIAARIFEPFFSTKPTGMGTGMGLAIVQGIVSQLNGKIYFDSMLGKGATFHLLLPLV